MLLLAASGVLAQGLGSQKIAVVDMQSVLVSVKDGQKALADLRAKFGPRNDALTKSQQDLQAKSEQLRRTQNTISEEARTTLERDIATMNRTIERDGQALKEDSDEAEQQMVSELGAKIMQVLTKYAADNHYTLVFDVSGQPANILFASTATDVTREIIAEYDKSAAAASSSPQAAGKPTAAPPAATRPAGSPAPRPSPPQAAAPK